MQYTNDWIHWFQFMVAFGIYWADLSFKQDSSSAKVNWKPVVIFVLWHTIVDTKATAVQHRHVWLSSLWTVRGRTRSGGIREVQKAEKMHPCDALYCCESLQWSKFASLKLTWVTFPWHWSNLCVCSKCHLLSFNRHINLVSFQIAALHSVSLTGICCICFPFQREQPPSASSLMQCLKIQWNVKAELNLVSFKYVKISRYCFTATARDVTIRTETEEYLFSDCISILSSLWILSAERINPITYRVNVTGKNYSWNILAAYSDGPGLSSKKVVLSITDTLEYVLPTFLWNHRQDILNHNNKSLWVVKSQERAALE